MDGLNDTIAKRNIHAAAENMFYRYVNASRGLILLSARKNRKWNYRSIRVAAQSNRQLSL